MKTRILIAMSVVALAIAAVSCQKSDLITEKDLDMAEDNVIAEAIFDDIFNSVDIASWLLEGAMKSDFSKGMALSSDSCPVVTVNFPDGTTWPKVITIDYGDGCTINEVTRKGKIIIEITARRHVTGSMRTVTFDGYYFNDIAVEGTKSIKNLGPNSSENIVIEVKLEGGKMTLPDGKTIEREVNRQREWIAGLNTPFYIWDDECLITGTTSGKNINDVTYTTTISTPLLWKRVCRFIVSGVILIEREGFDPVELDYGDGECDAKAVLRRGDEEKEILIRVRHKRML
ncbi:MAG: hypothetical protein R6W67_08465 [Bacteroidales bacterium]